MSMPIRALCAATCLLVASTGVSALEPKTDEEKMSYSLGAVLGQRLQTDLGEVIIPEAFGAGMVDAMTGTELKLTEEELVTWSDRFQEQQLAAQQQAFEAMAASNKEAGDKYRAEHAEKADVVVLESGLQYLVIASGEGDVATEEDEVEVHYTGRYIDGTVFDSSVERGSPAVFRPTDVIPGWREALQLMRAGDKWELVVPPELAYGSGGSRVIGPNETLVFEVELLSINPESEDDAAEAEASDS